MQETKHSVSNIQSIDDLKQAMKIHSADAQVLYDKAIELHCQNEQFFMDWQDSINVVSYVHEEDL